MSKALAIGTGVMILSLVAYYALVRQVSSEIAMLLGYGVPLSGAATASFLAPRSKFNVGAATSIPAFLVMGIGGYIAGSFGFGDFLGIQGTVFAMLLSAPLIAIASVCGALFGEWASKVSANA